MRFVNLMVIVCLLTPSASARIGENSLQFVDRYGPPKDSQVTKNTDKSSPLIEGAIHHTYEYHGWRIRAAFLELQGPAVRMDFRKIGSAEGPSIKDYELQAIMTANTPAGMSWRRIVHDDPAAPSDVFFKLTEALVSDAFGQKMWQRSDGAILWLRVNMIVQLELPIARQRDAARKAAKEQKARASVPNF